jgi:2-iminobutanoate/2-iminopropanoate deaminase
MPKKIIATDKAPAAIGPYSQAVQNGPFIFVSGQIPLNPGTGTLVTGDIRTQTVRVMDNIAAILQKAGQSMSAISKCTIYLKDLSNFGDVNEVYGSYFDSDPPARATVEVSSLPKDVDIEIDAIAYVED